MKLIKIALPALVSIALLSSCKKSDTTSPRNTLVGSWLTTRAAVDNNGNGVADASEIFAVDTLSMAMYNLKTDATISVNNYSNPTTGIFNGNWTLENNDQDIKVVQTDQGSGGITIQYHIVLLTDQDLTLSFKDFTDTTQIDFLMFRK